MPSARGGTGRRWLCRPADTAYRAIEQARTFLLRSFRGCLAHRGAGESIGAEALADFNEAIARQYDSAGLYFARGRAYQLEGDRNAAIADYRKALSYRFAASEYDAHAQAEARRLLAEFGTKP